MVYTTSCFDDPRIAGKGAYLVHERKNRSNRPNRDELRLTGVTVLVTNVDTNSVKRTTTNASGYYEVPLLDGGNYSVTVESIGFRKLVRSGIILNVNSRA